jgi:sugar (pentulose or hexulose) kinase
MGDRMKVMAVFDIGKTNKKVFLWNELYQIVFERQQNFNEIPDEAGFLGEDLPAVRSWMLQTFAEINALPEYQICALNFSGYGATVVFVDEKGHSVSPLYNYLKAFPEGLFPYSNYGGEDEFARATASPILGNLNSGLQAFRVSQVSFEVWEKTRWVMHWPNFLSSIFTGNFASEITSIGCHTALWDFDKKTYHDWVTDFGLRNKLPEIAPSNTSYLNEETNIPVGLGLHDSSSALVPYLRVMHSPFLLLSTGTWCIAMNPFDEKPLSAIELKNDVLCFLQGNGKPVKAARLFAGNTHEIQIKRLQEHYQASPTQYKSVEFNASYLEVLDNQMKNIPSVEQAHMDYLVDCAFNVRDLNKFPTYELAYVQLMIDLACQQIFSLRLLLKEDTPVTKILVDGGFSKNPLYMNFLVHAFPAFEIYGAEVAQASSLGAALMMHETWNTNEIPMDLVKIKKF